MSGVVTLSASKGTVSVCNMSALTSDTIIICFRDCVQVGGSGGTGGTSCRCPGRLAASRWRHRRHAPLVLRTCHVSLPREKPATTSGCPCRSRGPARADLALLGVRAELHTYTVCVCAMPRNAQNSSLGYRSSYFEDHWMECP